MDVTNVTTLRGQCHFSQSAVSAATTRIDIAYNYLRSIKIEI